MAAAQTAALPSISNGCPTDAAGGLGWRDGTGDADAGSARELADEPSLMLVLSHRARFLATAMRLVGEREAARDVLQAAYLKALMHGSRIHDPQQMVWWFGRVLSNTAIDFLRRREAHERLLRRIAAAGLSHQGGGAAPEDDGVCDCVLDLLATLKPSYASILRHVELGGRSLAEAARTEGLTPTNARVRLHRARRALRMRVVEVCGGSPLDRCRRCGCRTDRTEVPREVRRQSQQSL